MNRTAPGSAAMLAAISVASVGIFGVFGATALAQSAVADGPPSPATKKDQYLAAKVPSDPAASAKWAVYLDKQIGRPPPPLINIYNTWTHEFVPIDSDGRSSLSPERINDFLRCHFTNEPTKMDPRLVATIIKAARHFRSNRVDIVSGFRAPKYNLMLRKKGHEVARNSQHTHGNAVDFRVQGVPVRTLQAWAKRQRLGGVGLYPRSGFVHIDTARIRYWGGE